MSWGKHAIESDGALEILVGELGLHIAQEGRDFRIETSHDGTPDGLPERWALGRPAEELSVTPCLPDRPILVVTHEALWVPPGGETTLFVLLPLWARVGISRPGSVTIQELPTERMDNVWLGSKVRGHLGYWHPSAPRLKLLKPKEAHFGVAPVEIFNDSSHSLEVESLEVDCPKLPLYRTDHGLWLGSSAIRFNARGSITTTWPGTLPPGIEQLELISSPGSAGVLTIGSRTIARLRALSPL